METTRRPRRSCLNSKEIVKTLITLQVVVLRGNLVVQWISKRIKPTFQMTSRRARRRCLTTNIMLSRETRVSIKETCLSHPTIRPIQSSEINRVSKEASLLQTRNNLLKRCKKHEIQIQSIQSRRCHF
jgi:hypothetical protein